MLAFFEEQLGEIIKPYSEIPEAVQDKLSLYRWLYGVTEDLGGDAFLEVGKIGEDNHAVIDPMSELQLDHGSEMMKKVIKADSALPEYDEE